MPGLLGSLALVILLTLILCLFRPFGTLVVLTLPLSVAVLFLFLTLVIAATAASLRTRIDGDHTDAMVLLEQPTFPGCHIWARPVGGLRMRDDKGDDFKVLCVALGDPLYQHFDRHDQVSPHRLREIEHFFATYKLLEDKAVEIFGWAQLEDALAVLRADRDRWLAEQGSAH